MAIKYDIRSSENALNTLVELTGVDISTWVKYVGHDREYGYRDYLVKDVINKYGHLPMNYLDLDFIYFHVTTSTNECAAIKKHGILDLKHAYNCKESEIRIFLDSNGVTFDLENRLLYFKGKKYDITFSSGKCPKEGTQEYLCWLIGRKFYFDYATCGFLSIWERSPYGGQVHRRPEILWDIDNLLKLGLSETWEQSHYPYEITAHVKGRDIIFDGEENQSDEDKVLMYLTMAYNTAFGGPTEQVLIMKNGIQISPTDIIEIKPLSFWK